MLRCKRAQLGDTLTWLVATIIIFVILFFFIFGSSLMGRTKDVGRFKESIFSKSSNIESYDDSLSKSLYTYHQIEDSREKADFYRYLEEKQNQSGFEVNLRDRSVDIKRGLV